MGFYIEVPHSTGKVEQIKSRVDYFKAVSEEDAKAIAAPFENTTDLLKFTMATDLETSCAIVCVVENTGMNFEAALFCYDKRELEITFSETDLRPKTYIIIPWKDAVELSVFDEDFKRKLLL